MANNSLILVKSVIITGFFCYISLSNGSSVDNRLSAKRYNEASFIATHNGQSHLNCPVQNQILSLTQQFENGIRATKMHIWYDMNESGEVTPFVCHGVAREVVDGSYIEKIIEKIPKFFQSWARSAMKEFEPINMIFQDACNAAYGDGKKNGVIQMRHCVLDPSRKPLRDVLVEIKAFLEKNTQEVITLILEDHTNNLDQIADIFALIGLDNVAHRQNINEQWPLIKEMIDGNKRLVVLLHGDQDLDYQKYPWIHNVWDFAWDTEFDFPDIASLKDPAKDVMPKRGIENYNDRHGGVKNKLFIAHHFVTPLAGGTKDGAKKVNKKQFLKNRLDRLSKIAGQNPNIIQIDFFDTDDKELFELMYTF